MVLKAVVISVLIGVALYVKYLYNNQGLELYQIISYFLYLALLARNVALLVSKTENGPSEMALMRLFVAIK